MKKYSVLLFAFGTMLYFPNFSKAGNTCNSTPEQGEIYTAGFCIDVLNLCVPLGEPIPGEQPLPGNCFVKVDDPGDIITPN